MKLQQFLALEKGTEVKAFKGQRFIVDKRAELDGIEQPFLVNADTQEPLFGAIYIVHLMSFDGHATVSEEVDQEEGLVAATSTAPISTRPSANPADLTRPGPGSVSEAEAQIDEQSEDDIESYSDQGPGYASDNVSMVEATAVMITEQPSLEQYELWFEAPEGP